MKHLLYGTALALLLAVVTGQDPDECIQSLIDSQSERVASTCGYLRVQNVCVCVCVCACYYSMM